MIPIDGDYGSSAPLALGNASMPMQQVQKSPMDLKKQMALQMIAQQMSKMGGGQGSPQMQSSPQLDIYGNPVG